MKKILIAVLLVLGSVGIFAQAGTQYFAIMPGYQFTTGSFHFASPYVVGGHLYTAGVHGSGENSFVASLDYGYFFTDNIGLHAGYYYNEGRYKANIWAGPTYYNNLKFDRSLNLFEIGPEFAGMVGQNGQVYAQINVGYTFGSSSASVHGFSVGDFGENSWVYGGALGYRYYFNNSVGIVAQAAYHHFDKLPVNDNWDGRIGVSFKF